MHLLPREQHQKGLEGHEEELLRWRPPSPLMEGENNQGNKKAAKYGDIESLSAPDSRRQIRITWHPAVRFVFIGISSSFRAEELSMGEKGSLME